MLLNILLFLLFFFSFLLIFMVAYQCLHPIFGGHPNASTKERMKQSKAFNGKRFVNQVASIGSTMESGYSVMFDWFRSVLYPPANKIPRRPLPNDKFEPNTLTNGYCVWFGHSSLLFQLADKVLMTDPVFHRASPIPLTGRTFTQHHPLQFDDLPVIDLLLISHDHYDHLDYRTIKMIKDKVKHFCVPLGVKAHLSRWGVAEDKVSEFDWHQTLSVDRINLTFTPTQHFSGRGLFNHGSTLWGSWVIKTADKALFFSADSGYGKHFAEIGKNYGPFDFAFIENGAYDTNWPYVHMQPEESIQAIIDVQAKVAMPVHWAKFDLAFHPWREPVERFLHCAQDKNFQVVTPKLGQLFSFDALPQEKWWSEENNNGNY